MDNAQFFTAQNEEGIQSIGVEGMQIGEGVNVDDALDAALENLAIIDQYRETGDAMLLDRLRSNLLLPDDQNEESYYYEYGESNDDYSLNEEENDRNQSMSNFQPTREPLYRITEEGETE